MLSYSDFCFLLTLLSSPVRYIDTAFNLFDVTGDGNIEAKVGESLTCCNPVTDPTHASWSPFR